MNKYQNNEENSCCEYFFSYDFLLVEFVCYEVSIQCYEGLVTSVQSVTSITVMLKYSYETCHVK